MKSKVAHYFESSSDGSIRNCVPPELSIIIIVCAWIQFLCGCYFLKHKEYRHQHSGTAALCNADGQPHPPPRYPSYSRLWRHKIAIIHPYTYNNIYLYEQVQPIRAKTVDNVFDHKCQTAKPRNMSKNKAYSTSLMCPAPIHEDILQEDGGEEMEVTEYRAEKEWCLRSILCNAEHNIVPRVTLIALCFYNF